MFLWLFVTVLLTEQILWFEKVGKKEGNWVVFHKSHKEKEQSELKQDKEDGRLQCINSCTFYKYAISSI
ncbi:hypothetical protein CKY10_16525 [Photorhabdus sp. HUG-39]|nr:hypothetical protein CKY10_16525 [Photorhabdus sp. HUG-39]